MRLRLIVPIFVSLLVLSLALSVRRHRSESVESAETELGSPYLKTVFALADKRTLESILEADGAELMDRNWEEFRFDLRRIPKVSSWELEGRGRFKARVSGKDFSGEMDMVQDIHADKSGLTASSRLSRPSGFVKEHQTTTSIASGTPPILRVESRIVYERLVPFWMVGEVDRRVREHNRERVGAVLSVLKSATDR